MKGERDGERGSMAGAQARRGGGSALIAAEFLRMANATTSPLLAESRTRSRVSMALMGLGGLLVAGAIVWQAIAASGNPNPLAAGTSVSAAALDIAVLVFREGLECVLVLAAITAGISTRGPSLKNPIVAGVAAGLIASLATWFVAVRILTDLNRNVSALALQAGTGFLAVIVLLVVMNWFFHKLYWTGWISFHTNKKRELLDRLDTKPAARRAFLWGMISLGFTSVYREGFEVVLFLQSYRLKLGDQPVMAGVSLGLLLAAIVGGLTFVAHRRLPYRKMLILTGVLLGGVLMVMVGEQAQEMQLAHWLPTTTIPWLAHVIPAWIGLWFSVFPTVETLAAQGTAAALVLGCYAIANRSRSRKLSA